MDLDVIRIEYLKHSKYHKAVDTYKRYDTPHLNIITEFLLNDGYTDSEDLDYDALYDFIDYSRLKDNSNKTINKRIQLLNRAIMHFVKLGRCAPTIIATFPKLKEIDKRYNYIDEENMIYIINHLLSLPDTFRNIRNRMIIFLFIDTGSRLSEVTNIQVKNIDFKYNSILLEHTKVKKERIVYFSDFTAVHIKKYLDEADIFDGALLLNSKNMKPMNYLGVLRIFQKIKYDLNLENFSSHMIRHTYGTLAYEKDINEFFTNRTMGHAKMDMTRRYTHMNVKTNSKIYKTFAPMEHYINKK